MKIPIIPEKISDWNIQQLNKLCKYVGIESETFDFKKEPNQLDEHICAMANTKGGYLVLGIEEVKSKDKSRIIAFKKIGFPSGKEDKIRNQITNEILKLEPIPNVEIEHIHEKNDTKFYTVIKIHNSLSRKPIFVKNTDQCFVRIHDSKIRANRTIISNLFRNSVEESKELVENVYRICYNELMKVYDDRDFFTMIPPDPWNQKLDPTWRFKTDDEMKELFKEYSEQVQKWKKIWLDFGDKLYKNRHRLGEVVFPIFDALGLMKNNTDIRLTQNSHVGINDWVNQFGQVFFDSDYHWGDELYDNLITYCKLTGNGHEKFIEQWKNTHPELFSQLADLHTSLLKTVDFEYTKDERNEQRQKLKDIYEKLIKKLEEKIR